MTLKPTILYLLSEWPWPTDSGARVHDKIMLRCLSENWSTHVACWDYRPLPENWEGLSSLTALEFDGRYKRRKLIAAAQALLIGRPIPTRQYMSPLALASLARILDQTRPDGVVLCGVELAVLLPFLRSRCQARLIVDIHDVQTQRSRSLLESIPVTEWRKWLKDLALLRSFKTIEEQCYPHADVVWVMKEEDRSLIEAYRGPYRVDLVPNVVDPNQLADLERVRSSAPGEVRAAYVGNYGGEPNERCALDLISAFKETVFPRMDTQLLLIGVNPTERMRTASADQDRVLITGRVESLGDYLTPVDTVFVAPLLAGGGIKRKVIEAMMAGCPVVTTAVGAEGLELQNGTTAIITEPAEVAVEFVALARDRGRRIKLAEAAQSHVNARFGFERLTESIRTSFRALDIER